MWAKILGLLVVAIGLGSVGAYYAHHDESGCPLSGGGCPLSSGSCSSVTSSCPSDSPSPCCADEQQATPTVTEGAAAPKCPLCEGK